MAFSKTKSQPPTISSYTIPSIFSIVSSVKTSQRLCSSGSPLACTQAGSPPPRPATLITQCVRSGGGPPGHALCDFFLLH